MLGEILAIGGGNPQRARRGAGAKHYEAGPETP